MSEHVLIAGDEFHDSQQRPAMTSTDFHEERLGVPSCPPSGGCVIVQDGHGTNLSKDPATPMYDQAADPVPSSVMFPDASDVAAGDGASLLTEDVSGRRE